MYNAMVDAKKELIRCLKEKEPYTITEKMDGSLGIIYNYNGKWRVNTRGSFSSEQAQRASEILKKYKLDSLYVGATILVEIIYPSNKIVVDYGQDEKLVILSAVWTDKQEEFSREELESLSQHTKMPLVNELKYTIDEMIELQKTLPKDEEGFVVRFNSGLRVKIKGREYLRVHKLISQISPLSFFESMDNGKVRIDYLQELPEEYREEAEVLTKTLEDKYKQVSDEIKYEVDTFIRKNGFVDMKERDHRKRVGLYVKDAKPRHGSAIFSTLNGQMNRLDQYIMKQIRPKGNVL